NKIALGSGSNVNGSLVTPAAGQTANFSAPTGAISFNGLTGALNGVTVKGSTVSLSGGQNISLSFASITSTGALTVGTTSGSVTAGSSQLQVTGMGTLSISGPQAVTLDGTFTAGSLAAGAPTTGVLTSIQVGPNNGTINITSGTGAAGG